MIDLASRYLAAFAWTLILCLLSSLSALLLVVVFWVLGKDDIYRPRVYRHVRDPDTILSFPTDTPSFAALVVMLFIAVMIIVAFLSFLHWKFLATGGDDASDRERAREARDLVVVVVSTHIAL